jgi:hypothetical protein
MSLDKTLPFNDSSSIGKDIPLNDPQSYSLTTMSTTDYAICFAKSPPLAVDDLVEITDERAP